MMNSLKHCGGNFQITQKCPEDNAPLALSLPPIICSNKEATRGNIQIKNTQSSGAVTQTFPNPPEQKPQDSAKAQPKAKDLMEKAIFTDKSGSFSR